MFDIAFSELIIIALVALIVIGPEKLPKVARTLGALMGRMQRYVNTVKADINRELQFDDLQKIQQEIQHSARLGRSEINQLQTDIQDEVLEIEQSITGGAKPPETPDNLPSGNTLK